MTREEYDAKWRCWVDWTKEARDEQRDDLDALLEQTRAEERARRCVALYCKEEAKR
jgi:hypothetical protein